VYFGRLKGGFGHPICGFRRNIPTDSPFRTEDSGELKGFPQRGMLPSLPPRSCLNPVAPHEIQNAKDDARADADIA